jgi:pimeloyl-ACP methyl ester carboxylesterase
VRLWLTAFLLSLLILAGWSSKPSEIRQFGVFAADPPTPYFHYAPQGQRLGRVLVVHGLDANKEMMNLLCLGLSDAGFEVYSVDLPGHGDSKVGFNAVGARQAVNAVLDTLGPNTIVIGHSLGGALLLDLASVRSYGTMVLLSPAPTPVDKIRAERMLVLTGEFELPRIQAWVPQLEISWTEGVTLRRVPWSGHAGYLLQPGFIRDVVTWLGGDPSRVHSKRRLFQYLLEILSAISIAALWLRGKPIRSEQTALPARILSYVAACMAALWICAGVDLLGGLRLFTTDYLVSFILVMGVALLPFYFRRFRFLFSQIHVSIFAAASVIAAAVFIGSELVHLTLSDGQWWRFAAITLAVLPLCVADEVLLRPLRPWWKAAGISALTRILIWAYVVWGVTTTNRGDAFLVLITHFIVLLWIVLWFVGELVRRRTQDPMATAVFTALVQAWVFAAIFVRT